MCSAGVARSIESDVDNLMRLISIANILPKGMYVENAVKVRCACLMHWTRCRASAVKILRSNMLHVVCLPDCAMYIGTTIQVRLC